MRPFIIHFLLLLLISMPAWSQKQVVITLDDLPVTSPRISLEETREINKKILATLKKHQVPAIGFVNEYQLQIFGEVDDQVDILRLWVDQGMDLGNHTYSHMDYNNTPFEEFTEDLDKGDFYTNLVLQEKGKKAKFFRPPYLNVGNTAEGKEKLKLFLEENGYVIAPATVENSDFIFNTIYLKAKVENDTSLMRQTTDHYLDFTAQRLSFYEDVALELTGSLAVPQIFLCHANTLNADCLDQLLKLFKNRGYEFISLEEALKHKAYKEPDNYIGNEGVSWLLRGDIQNREEILAREPKIDESIVQQYSETTEQQFWVLLKPRILGLNPTMLLFGLAFLLIAVGVILWIKPFKRVLQNH